MNVGGVSLVYRATNAMKILVSTDKFKGTLSALQAGVAILKGLRRSGRAVELRLHPLADGGDGTLECFLSGGATRIECRVHDPLMRPVQASYALLADGSTACIEMATASGLMLLRKEEYTPLRTTSLGTGELIRDAISRGARNVLLGIGGSATNDGGTGMMVALGTRFLDKVGDEVFPCGGSLGRVAEVDERNLLPGLRSTTFTALCDVTNPFYGEDGAAAVYAPQKGASQHEVRLLDSALQHLASVIMRTKGIDLQRVPGAGAGGGLAGGAVAWLGAHLRSGIETIMEQTDFDRALQWADVVITGEGKVDRQSARGKVVSGVIQRAQQAGKRVILVCGQAEPEAAWPNVPIYTMVEYAGPARSFDKPAETLEQLVATLSI